MKLISVFISSIIVIYLTGCSASTGSRYEKNEIKNEETHSEINDQIDEDFDITPYKTDVELESEPISMGKLPPDVWYQYDESEMGTNRKITGTSDGYRVQVIATDNLEEANQVRSEVYSRTTNKEVYVNFEPPFYKVKVGDFTSISDANDLKFMLNQLGYKEARVVQETVNLFE